MIVGDDVEIMRFSKLHPGDVWMCPQSQESFMVVSGAEGLNCVRLLDGKLMNRAEDLPVDFYRGARLVVP